MKTRRTKIFRSLFPTMLLLAAVLLLLPFGLGEWEKRQAQAAYAEDGLIQYLPTTDTSYNFGTPQNPFTVLEIVAYPGYAEFGYLVGGKEPVDMERLCRIARGAESSPQISASAASEFIEYLITSGYMEAMTEAEAEKQNAKDAELPTAQRKFACYRFKNSSNPAEKCYVTNKNGFLRESVGLKYVTRGSRIYYDEFDIDSYEFVGWYRSGTNEPFDFSERLFHDVEVYAKWRMRKSNGETIEPVIATPTPNPSVPAPGFPDGITIRFESAIPASLSGGTTIVGLPSSINGVMTNGTKWGTAVSEPAAPTLTGSANAGNYVLRGWSVDPGGTDMYRFGDPIPSSYISGNSMTLYPVWAPKEDCLITFDAAVPGEYAIVGNNPSWPAQLSGPGNGSGETVRFLNVSAGTKLSDSGIPQLSMLGNVDYKVKNYVIDVVTATPEDLNRGGNVSTSNSWEVSFNPAAELDNIGLIRDANLILLSPQSHFIERYNQPVDSPSITDVTSNRNNKVFYQFGADNKSAVQIWEATKKASMFNTVCSYDEDTIRTYGFGRNDLCWEATTAIFTEVVLTEPKAALIFDAESYHMTLLNGNEPSTSSESPKKIIDGREGAVSIGNIYHHRFANLASSNNVYKLYIMMNQMEPRMFYETFLRDHVQPTWDQRIGAYQAVSTGTYSWAENTTQTSNEDKRWNTATFWLCSLLDSDDDSIYIDPSGQIVLRDPTVNPWEKWGIVNDLFVYSDDIDDATGESIVENGIIRGNCFTYESDTLNISKYFATGSDLPNQQHVSDVYDYYDRDQPEHSVKMSEVLYYLLQQSVGNTSKASENGSLGGAHFEPTPTATPIPTATPTPTVTPNPSMTPGLTATPTPTLTPTPIPTPGVYDKDIRMLELQPSEDGYRSDIAWKSYLNGLVNGYTGAPEVVRQNSAEFIGKIEEMVGNYDLIYIGDNINGYPEEKAATSFNIMDYAEPTATLHRKGETVTLAEDTRIISREERMVSYSAGSRVTIQEEQTIYRKANNSTLLPPGRYTFPVGVDTNVHISRIYHTNNEDFYGWWDVREPLSRGASVWTKIYPGDEVEVTDGAWAMYPEEYTVHHGDIVQLDYAQSIVEYGEEISELVLAGTTVTLTMDQTLRALLEEPSTSPEPYRYFHTGAMVNLNPSDNRELEGALGGDSDTVNEFYYSGNDITKEKAEQLRRYVESGYPVIVANELMVRSGEGDLEVDTTKVDSASNMYRLLSDFAAGENDPTSVFYGKIVYEGDYPGNEHYENNRRNLLTALYRTKCDLRVTRMPVLYSDGEPIERSYLNGAPGKEDERKIEIAFTISDAENTTYHLRFYIDRNADGRYDESTERVNDRITVFETMAGLRSQVTQLRTGRNYLMSADLSEYVGIIPWKLEIVRNDNPVIRDSVIEFSAILPPESERPTLKVLQVMPDGANPSSTVYLPTKEEIATLEWLMPYFEDIDNVGQLSRSWNGSQTKWTWTQINDFKNYWGGKGEAYNSVWKSQANTNRLKQFYNEWQTNGLTPEYLLDALKTRDDWELRAFFFAPTEAINDGDVDGRRLIALGFWLYMRNVKDFKIEADRVTINEFSSRTATHKAADGAGFPAWAQEEYDMLVLGFNDCYQDIADDDVIAVIEEFIASGKQILFTHDTTSFRNYTDTGRDGDYWGYNINREFRDMLGMDRFGATLMYPLDRYGNVMGGGQSIREAINRKGDAPYKTGTSQEIGTDALLDTNVLNTTSDGQKKYYVQGFSDLLLYRMAHGRSGSPLITTTVSKVNTGQMTEYPYRVGSGVGAATGNISVAQTHEQYYQLDMEANDIVVWYTLEGDTEPYNGTRHDVRNNYYLYSRGNIIYSGVGHNRALTYDEMKLFVNTFVASYRVPAEPPNIDVTNSQATTTDTEYFYIDFDSRDEETPIGIEVVKDAYGNDCQRVRFVVQEIAPLRNQSITMELFSERTSATGVELLEQTDRAAELRGSGYYVERDAGGAAKVLQTMTELLPNEEYYLDIPLSILSGNYSAELLLRVGINYGRRNDQYVYDYQKIRFLRRGLYDLD